MPAAAVIPAPRVYTNVVAVKTLVVELVNGSSESHQHSNGEAHQTVWCEPWMGDFCRSPASLGDQL